MPTYVGKTNVFEYGSGPYSSAPVPYVPVLGNCLLMCVLMENGSASVSQVTDDQGNDIFENPINSWQNLGTITLSTTRMELWGCLSIKQVPAVTTVYLSAQQNVLFCGLREYSGVSSFGLSGTVSNTGYSSLFFQGTAINNTDILVSFFGLPNNTDGWTGSGTYNIPGQANFVITPAVSRDSFSGFGWTGQVVTLEQTVINNPQLLISQIYLLNYEVATTGLMACGVVLQGGFALQTPPGFSDIDVSQLTAGSVLHALKMNQIAQNAGLGMVRPEFFYGTYLNGDTVVEPVSPVDQYQYSRDELIYIYTPYTTFDVSSGWASAGGILFYCLWDVDPVTGAVTIKEVYHPDGNTPVNQTNDGQLIVLTIGQRGNSGQVQTGLTMKETPSIVNTPTGGCGEDYPVTQSFIQAIAENSKFAAVKAEVFYLGEFVDGEVVTPPISYVDGYQYSYNEVAFMSSWLWTCNPNAFGPPPMATATGAPAHGGWSQMNELQASITSSGVVTARCTFYNNKVIDPLNPSNGGLAYGRLRVYAFCQRTKGPYFGIPPLTDNVGSSSSTTYSFVHKVTGVVGSITGKLSVSVPASTLGNCPISKIVVLRTAVGGDAVIDSTTLYSGGTVTAGTTLTTTPVAFTMDGSHDYYFVSVLTNGFFVTGTFAGQINSQYQTSYALVSGVDLSGYTTISSMGLTVNIAYWAVISAIYMTITGDSLANEFAEIPLTDEAVVFAPGNTLTYPYMAQLAQNVKEACYAVEFFGPTNHVYGDVVPLPTSPVDGYTYSREELLYIWQWHDTGTPVIRLYAWGASIAAATGTVNMMVYHVGDGGPVINDYAGASIDVITIGCRSQQTSSSNNPLSANNGNPPSDVSSVPVGGQGGYTINGAS